ncbi:MAG: aminopeptidase P N-terminal domain-containing protein, partial [Planctomycetota bacterium]
MARTGLILLLLATTVLASPADSLTGVDMRAEHAARRQAVADLLGEGILVLFAAPQRGYGDYRPEPNLFWLTGVDSPNIALVMRMEAPEATDRARRARVLADRIDVTISRLRRAARGLRGIDRDDDLREDLDRARRARDEALRFYAAERGPIRLTTWLHAPGGGPMPAARWTKNLVAPDARELTGIENIGSLRQLRGRSESTVPDESRFFTLLRTSPTEFERKWLDRAAEGAFRHYADSALAQARHVKSAEEIARLRRACELTAEGLVDCMKTARPGVFEYELQAHLEFTCRRGGARRQAFASIVGSGPNSVILHYSRNDRKTEDGDLVLMDVGAEFRGYASDVTRTFPVNGKFTERQAELYDIVLAAQRAGIAAIRPGVEAKEVAAAARAVITKAGYGKSLPHSICHYVGLDVHDPAGGSLLEPGVVLTVEPGIYLADEGIGIRIEDTV